MKYVSIDIETTGLNPNKHQMIEFGAVVEDTENLLPIGDLPTFRCLFPQEDYVVNPYCLTLHTKLYKELGESGGMNDEHFTMLFRDFLINNNIDPLKVIVAGKNFNGFDRGFIEPHLNKEIKFLYRALDPTTLYVRPEDIEPPSLEECARRAGLEFTGSGYHTAVSDAIMVIELLRKGWNRGK